MADHLYLFKRDRLQHATSGAVSNANICLNATDCIMLHQELFLMPISLLSFSAVGHTDGVEQAGALQ